MTRLLPCAAAPDQAIKCEHEHTIYLHNSRMTKYLCITHNFHHIVVHHTHTSTPLHTIARHQIALPQQPLTHTHTHTRVHTTTDATPHRHNLRFYIAHHGVFTASAGGHPPTICLAIWPSLVSLRASLSGCTPLLWSTRINDFLMVSLHSGDAY